jgi:altronate dehydratase large subunit
MTTIRAYRRDDGRVGIRNHIAVIPTSVCAGVAAAKIADQVPGAVALVHQHGCCQMGADMDQTVRTLTGLGRNPNVGAVLIVELGCEGLPGSQVLAGVAATGKPVERLCIQASGGITRTVAAGVQHLASLKARAECATRTDCPLGDIMLGLECGGSDATSGVAGNLVLGAVSDMLIRDGGSSILSETTEMIGAEHVLCKRAQTPAVAERLLHIINRVEARALASGVDLRHSQPTPGNIAGGISTIEEKSLGCVYKAGSAPIRAVLEYAEAPPPDTHGLLVMDTPGQDIESITGMVAGGAQVVAFTTGLGSPTGCPIAPVIKVTGNRRTRDTMDDAIDFDASAILEEGADVRDLAQDLFNELVDVCNGKSTRSELNGHFELGIYRVGFTY